MISLPSVWPTAPTSIRSTAVAHAHGLVVSDRAANTAIVLALNPSTDLPATPQSEFRNPAWVAPGSPLGVPHDTHLAAGSFSSRRLPGLPREVAGSIPESGGQGTGCGPLTQTLRAQCPSCE